MTRCQDANAWYGCQKRRLPISNIIGGLMEKRLVDVQPVVKKHLARAGNFDWEKYLKDPRSKINRKWHFNYLLTVIYYAMLSGKENLRK